MKLSDVMSAAGLASYAEVGLCIFFFVFVAVSARTFRRGQAQEFARLGALPLADEHSPESPAAKP
jgi:cbb3-type cytochrome oxidase subunit 3